MGDPAMINDVHDNPAMNRFELHVGDLLAMAYYRRDGDTYVLTHTEVPFEFSGQGIGSRLAEAVLVELRSRSAKIVPQCSFFGSYVARHPEFADLVA